MSFHALVVAVVWCVLHWKGHKASSLAVASSYLTRVFPSELARGTARLACLDSDESGSLTKSHPIETSWYTNGLPFECTECGKCCKTQGSVYLSPTEVKQAATLLDISASTFVERYASRTLHHDNQDDDVIPWVRLVNSNDGACVFLNDDNQCMVYEARPIQCSTFPFWPDLMKSPSTWNAEVRIPDKNDDIDMDIPYWSKSQGGCEGMQLVMEQHTAEQQSSSYVLVSPYVAYEQLMAFERNEQSFPAEPIIRRVKRTIRNDKRHMT